MLHSDPLSICPEKAQLNTKETSAIFKLNPEKGFGILMEKERSITHKIGKRSLSQLQSAGVRIQSRRQHLFVS